MISQESIITICVVSVAFFGNAMYLKGMFTEKIKNNKEDIDDLKGTVRYKDTCDSVHEGINKRVSRLETCANGNLQNIKQGELK